LVVAFVLTLAVMACGGSYVPTAPTPTQTRAPDPTFTVSGVVVGQGSAPVEGAQVWVAGQRGTTDGSGAYSIQGVPRSYGGVTAMKAGYAVARRILTVSGDTQFDFQLGPRVAIYTLSGVVSEQTPTGLIPMEGVQMSEYSCEEVSPAPPFFGNACPVVIYQTTTTDKKGFYSFSGLYSGKENSITPSKDGFEDPRTDPNGPEGNGQAVTIDGSTRLDLHLIRG
jgi:hypothetical protein